jgi:hypothetical protein
MRRAIKKTFPESETMPCGPDFLGISLEAPRFVVGDVTPADRRS